MNKNALIFGAIVIIILVSIGTFWGYYFYSQKEANKRAYILRYEKEFLPLKYNGKVTAIHKRDECHHAYQFDGLIVSYVLCICENEKFRVFVTVGDSVVKKAGDPIVTFIKPDGKSETFEMPFCHLPLYPIRVTRRGL
jgi:hypothetical protein